MTIDSVEKISANYQWQCPYCEKTGFTEWNKSCFYQLSEHIQDNHLELGFNAVINRFRQCNEKQQKQMIDDQWGILSKNIKEVQSD